VAVQVDVTDATGMHEWLETLDEKHPIDMVVANAGVSEATIGAQNDPVKAAKVLLPINITGVMNSVLPLIEPMKTRGHGTIVLMASLASFGPITNSAAYSASKVAVRIWGEALRTELARHGVDVCVVCPGFVSSPMTAVNKFYMPGLIDMDACIAYIREGLLYNAPVTAFPPSTYTLAQMAGSLPTVVRDALARWRALPGLYFYRRKSSKGARAASTAAAGAAAKKK
jgi:NAD(P)-dependent dehydrogenase (short-subunit alcohol dehydrogenase family)